MLNMITKPALTGALLSITVGSAFASPLPLDVLDTADVDYTSYVSDCGGGIGCISDATSLGAGGGGDHFDDAFGVTVDGVGYSPTQGTDGANTLALESLSFGPLQVAVEFLTSGPFLRQIIDITNTGGTALATSIGWHNNTGNDGNQQVVQTSDGDALAETSDSWVVTADALDADADNEVNGWAFQGFGGLAPTTLTLDDGHPVGFGGAGDEGLSTWFNLLVGAGETQSLMFFAVIEGYNADGVSGVQSLYDPGTFATLTADLTPARLAGVQNWGASAAVPLPAGFALLLAALGGLGLMGRRRG